MQHLGLKKNYVSQQLINNLNCIIIVKKIYKYKEGYKILLEIKKKNILFVELN